MAANATRISTHAHLPATRRSRTPTIDATEASEQAETSVESGEEAESSTGTLRLHGDISARTPRKIKWDENIVDNENMGKKKSKGMITFKIHFDC